MKTLKLLFAALFLTVFTVSCYVEDDIVVDTVIIETPTISLNQLLTSYDLWYIDINATTGDGEVPFLQKAFTVTFDYGVLKANNNLVGIGKTGNGYGITVADYKTFNDVVGIQHDVDGYWELEVNQINNRTIELYHRSTRTAYVLNGYQRNTFNYDMVFYDNLQYFLQEYKVWQKTYTSNYGAINDFDEENFLQFLTGNNTVFRSSIDNVNTAIDYIFWDYEGVYKVYDVAGDATLKTLTLDYDFMGNDYFELYVIDDETIELYHPDSGTEYRFTGRGYMQYLKTGKTIETKKRIKIQNPIMDVSKKRIN